MQDQHRLDVAAVVVPRRASAASHGSNITALTTSKAGSASTNDAYPPANPQVSHRPTQDLKAARALRSSKSQSSLTDSTRQLQQSQEFRSSSATLGQSYGPSLRRDNKPSPLQREAKNSTQQQSAASRFFDKLSSLSPTSPTSREEPRSPRQRLEALLTSEETVSIIGPTTDGRFSRVDSPPPSISSVAGLPARPKTSSVTSSSVTNAQTRATHSLSRPSTANTTSTSLSSTTISMPLMRLEPRSLSTRNASLDSAVSTMSSASQSTHSTLPIDLKQDMGHPSVGSGLQDTLSIIATAGSAEAALQTLLRERQSAQAHNAQLWRLVEKQRAMIFGLNQDLERTLKDKERYRRKVKDLASQLRPEKLSTADREDSGREKGRSADKSISPARTIETQIDANDFPSVPASKIHPESLATHIVAARNVDGQDGLHVDSAPSSGSISGRAFGSAVTSQATSPVHSVSSVSDGARKTSVSSAVPPSGKPSPAMVKSVLSTSYDAIPGFTPISPMSDLRGSPRTPMTPPKANDGLPLVSIIEATPLADAGVFPSPPARSSMSLRKNIPKPLNLGHTVSQPPDVVVVGADMLGSPEIEQRGRRRTRRADDQARETLAIEEEEVRSASKKSDGTVNEGTKDVAIQSEPLARAEQLAAPVRPFAGVGLPASPRLPKKLFGLLSPSGSDTSTASSQNVQRSSFMTPPLASPGLPLSPRPMDRPGNAPAPRFPKHEIATPPLSPRLGLSSFVPQALRRSPPQQNSGVDSIGFQSLNDQMAAYPAPLFSKDAVMRPGTAVSEDQPTLTITSAPLGSPRADATFIPAISEPNQDLVTQAAPSGNVDAQGEIYKGFVSEQYPNLLLPPNALPLIDVRVFSSRMQPKRASIMMLKQIESEDAIFVLGIYSRSDGQQLWRLEKTIQSLPALHQKIQLHCRQFEGKLPDRSLFTGHAPTRVDARRAALNAYFDLLLDTLLEDKAALAVCEFFSRDVIGPDTGSDLLGHEMRLERTGSTPSPNVSPLLAPEERSVTTLGTHEHRSTESLLARSNNGHQGIQRGGMGRREGFLTKRGKNFGGWKARYFVLDGSGPELKYYDSPGGPQIGAIKLATAQIGKQQSQHPADDVSEYSTNSRESAGRKETEIEENQYRHAFLILEPRRKDSSTHLRHVLCAESDAERDAWVAACLQYVESTKHSRDERRAPQSAATNSADGRVFEGSSRGTTSKDSKRSPVGSRKATSSTSRSRDRLTHAHARASSGSRERNTSNGHMASLPTVPSPAVPTQYPLPKSSPADISRFNPTHYSSSLSRSQQSQQHPDKSSPSNSPMKQREGLQAFSYDKTVAAEAPVFLTDTLANSLSSPTMASFAMQGLPTPLGVSKQSISGPTNATLIQNMEVWGLSAKTPVKEKKRSIFASFRGRPSDEMDTDGRPQLLAALERKLSNRTIFGIPLLEAVELSQPIGVDTYLPAVVYRAFEFLRAKNAASEEGIFRLSGSSVVIKALRERFNTECDVRLLECEEYYDIHAVASLLKLYLRELPQSILSRELHLEFIKAMEQIDHQAKIANFAALVSRLPRANRELLQALCMFLLEITENSDINKMNVRNVGIVFAPTLNIPNVLISHLLNDYASIFVSGPASEALTETERSLAVPNQAPQQATLSVDSIRSPRHQMFSDLPTPMATQQTFPSSVTGFQPIAFNTMSNQRHTFQPESMNRQFYSQSTAFDTPSSSFSRSTGSADTGPPATFSSSTSTMNSSITAPSNPQHLSVQPPLTNYSGATGKKGRRESSMIGAGMGSLNMPRKSSYQTLRDTSSSRIPEHMVQTAVAPPIEVEDSPVDRPMAKGLW